MLPLGPCIRFASGAGTTSSPSVLFGADERYMHAVAPRLGIYMYSSIYRALGGQKSHLYHHGCHP